MFENEVETYYSDPERIGFVNFVCLSLLEKQVICSVTVAGFSRLIIKSPGPKGKTPGFFTLALYSRCLFPHCPQRDHFNSSLTYTSRPRSDVASTLVPSHGALILITEATCHDFFTHLTPGYPVSPRDCLDRMAGGGGALVLDRRREDVPE